MVRDLTCMVEMKKVNFWSKNPNGDKLRWKDKDVYCKSSIGFSHIRDESSGGLLPMGNFPSR
jgi:hypothetical protein